MTAYMKKTDKFSNAFKKNIDEHKQRVKQIRVEKN